MRTYTVRAVLTVLLVAGALLAGACDEEAADDTGETPTGAADTPTGAAAGETPTPTAPDADGDGASGDPSIELTGEASGSLTVEGITCDYLGGATATYGASISGTVGDSGEQVTLDVSGSQGDPAGIAELTRTGGEYAKWDNSEDGVARAGSGAVTVTADGGDLSVDLIPALIDPGAATGNVHVEGTWVCPGGSYTGAP
jgi:hypothetical protein